MKKIDVDIWDYTSDAWERISAIVDTGATVSVLRVDLAKSYGYSMTGTHHFWQMVDPITVPGLDLRVMYNGTEVVHDAVAVPIKSEHRRPIVQSEECTRPSEPHNLTDNIVLGMSFLDSLPIYVRNSVLSI